MTFGNTADSAEPHRLTLGIKKPAPPKRWATPSVFHTSWAARLWDRIKLACLIPKPHWFQSISHKKRTNPQAYTHTHSPEDYMSHSTDSHVIHYHIRQNEIGKHLLYCIHTSYGSNVNVQSQPFKCSRVWCISLHLDQSALCGLITPHALTPHVKNQQLRKWSNRFLSVLSRATLHM